MVFESVVVDLLNRFLGDYVENLDRSQLQIGIWGGDVVLNNLELKQTALNDLDLPVQTVYGHLGKLVLKIPWKNLYGAPVIACIEQLYLLAAPNQEVEYNAEKEDLKLLEEKRKELQRIEAAKKKEAEKNLPKPDDSFVEKLATQIIKNVQLKIRDIHIRYEDKVTNPKHPFSAGVTLSNLTVETTDDKWQANIVSDALSKIFKIVELEGLAVYWNCNSNHMTGMTPDGMLSYFHSGIASRDNTPLGYNYLLGPINSTARLRLNPKPDQDEPAFITPKVVLNLNMEKLSIALTKVQYKDLILLAESMDRMTKGKCYRKYRPFLTTYRGHYKQWWRFAYECILNEEVRRKRDNWCWDHMRKHRNKCKDYANAYQEKLRNKKLAPETQNTLDMCEKHLDLRNLVIIRQKIEVEVERLEKVATQGTKPGRSWLASWWGGSASPEDKAVADTVDIMKKFEDAMTPEEKKKLFRAIDYQENSAPTEYPKTFVENNVEFVLEKLEIKVRDDTGACVLSTELNRVECQLDQRPAASAMKVQLRMKEFSIYGLEQDQYKPQLVTSKETSNSTHLLDVLFETNPLDGACDQRVHLLARPLQILYDGQTIQKVIEVFKPPSESTEIANQIQSAASTRLANMKEMSATGIQYAVQKQSYTEIKIDVIAPYFLVPRDGVFTGNESLFIMDLGRLQVHSRPRSSDRIQDMHQQGLTEQDILAKMMSQSYDVFELKITDMQALFALESEDWFSALKGTAVTPLHLLQPTSLSIAIHKCLIEDDPRLPKIRVLGQLTSVVMNFSDMRLIEMLSLVKSLPIMQEAEMAPPLAESQHRASSLSLLKYFAMPDKTESKKKQHSDKMIDQLVQMTDLTVDFELKELVVTMYNKLTPIISRTDLITPEMNIDPATYEDKLISFHVLALELNLVQHPYDMDVVVKLGGVALNHFKTSGVLNVISTPMTTGQSDYLFTVKYIKVDRKSPVFQTKHKCVEQLVDLHFTTLKLLLHQQGIAEILKVMNDMQTKVEEINMDSKTDRIASIGTMKEPLSTIAEDSSVVPTRPYQQHRAPRKRIDKILFKISAQLDQVCVELATNVRRIADLAVTGLNVAVCIKESYTQVAVQLKDVKVADHNKKTRHNKILSVEDSDALVCNLIMYNLEHTSEYNQNDMLVDLNMGCVKVVFLNCFVTSVLDFLNEFQAAQQAIIDSAHEAAQGLKQNMKNAQVKATRIELKIKLKAPIVIVPVNSTSMEALIVDLGLISISNRFICLEVKNDQDTSAVVDEMKLQLDNLQLCRVFLDNTDTYQPVWESKILKPTSFVLNIKRNLSAVWYNCIPDIDMSGRIKSIELYLRQDDMRMIMQVLAQNLTEGQTDKKPPMKNKAATDEVFLDIDNRDSRRSKPSSLSVPVESYPTGSKHESSIYHSAESQLVEGQAQQQSSTQMLKVNTVVRFAFSMDTLILDLLTCKQNQQSDNKTLSEAKGLARFSLQVLSLKGHLFSDGSLTTSILLIDCLLDDTRPARDNKLKRYIERRNDLESNQDSSNESSTRSMIDITYRTKGNDMFADVRVFSFNLILSVDYLMTVADFFTSSMQPDSKPNEQVVTHAPGGSATLTVVSSNTAPPTRQKSTSKAAAQKNSTTESKAMMTVNVRVEKPDIILVESMDDINCNAIILNNEIILKLRMTGAHQVINGTIKDFNLYTCVYNPEIRASTVYNILKPCSLSLAGSTPESKGLHLDLCVTDIRLSVSPATIELLNKILVTMTSKEGSTDEQEVEPVDYTATWDVKSYKEDDYWFLKAEEAEEALSVSSTLDSLGSHAVQQSVQELCLVSIPSIVVTIEAGVGQKTLPMILCETSVQAAVHNWSSQLSVESTLSVQMSYYNSTIALWEPFIELVEQVKESKLIYQPWQLKLQVDMNSQSAEDISTEVIRPPGMSINVSSTENLELTVTKTGLEVLSALGKAFGAAIKRDGKMARAGQAAPYEVRNDTGLDITLLLSAGPFMSYRDTSYESIVLCSGARAELQLRQCEATPTADKPKEKYITAKINELNLDLSLPVSRADCRYFPLHHRGDSGDTWGVISEVQVEDGGTIVTIRSILQVYNHLTGPVDVYYMTRQGNQVECIGTVDPNAYLNLPLHAVYTNTNEIFFSIPGYTLSTVPFVWKELQSTVNLSKVMHCEAKGRDEKDSFFIKAVGELKQVYHENTTRHTLASSSYILHLRAALVLYNRLPVEVVTRIGAVDKIIQPGHSMQLPNAEPGQAVFIVRLDNYLEKSWSCRLDLSASPSEFSVWSFESHDGPQTLTLDLGLHTVDRNGSVSMTLYCPFWMLNKTGLMLSYRNSDESANVLYHPENFKGPLLFSFRPKNFFGKKKASIRIDDGEWSEKFSLDVVGSSGVVVCKANDRVYQIGVANQLTYNSLTKQVMFTPYYVLINEAAIFIQCQEADRPGDPWVKVQPGECTAFWPRSDKEDKLLRVKCGDDHEITAPFIVDNVQTTLLRLNNKYGGVLVEVQVTEGSVYVSLMTYSTGMAPALIINHTDMEISLWEKESINIRKIPPSHRMYYTWENPAGPRGILIDTGKKNEPLENELRKDDTGSITMSDSSLLYWVSFLDGMQRVLLLTSQQSKAENALSAGDLDTLDQEIVVSIHGLGLSLVNNQSMMEIMYIGIASSGVIWETRKASSKRFKQLSIAECDMIEGAYQRYESELQAFGQSPNSKVFVDAKTEIDLENLIMLRPHVRQLRRTFHTGLWLTLKTSPYQVQLHAKVNRLQIDDQMHDCVFPVVLAPVAPPKSLADVVLKPFAELSVVQRKLKHSSLQQFKYCQLLVQEFHVKLDLGFINAIVDMFQPDEVSEKEAAELFAKDLTLVDQSLTSLVASVSLQEAKSFYDSLHFSPLKIHVSFSMQGAGGAPGALPDFLSVLLQGIGVTLTDLHDVVFRLAYFQRDYCFLSQKQLISEATSHYTGQAVKQLYVLVLGLDVIGNPFGLVVGITKGVEDLFYEPFQGAIQGPGEFAEGLVLGMRSLFGHTVGGAAGAFSRITGAMGKGLAALTFDKDYQRKRMDQLNKRPANLQEGLARSSKGLVMGVFDGVTGVFTQPISGAREQGVEGFFKGLGKGAVGLVTRPTAGIVDFASGSFDAVKRATDMGDETTRLRSPRFLQPDMQVRAYNRHEADGSKLLVELEKGRYANTDVYAHHHVVIQGKDVLMLTDKRVAYVVKNDIFGGWQVDWSYTWHEIKSPVTIVARGIVLTVAEPKKKVLSMFSAKDSGKLILVLPEHREDLAGRMEALRKNI